MTVRPWCKYPLTYVVRMRREMDSDTDVAFVRARWVKADDAAVWWCARHRSIRCEDVEAVEAHREGAGLPRLPVSRGPDDR